MSNRTILIADDEPFILRSLSFVLKKEGFHVETAKDGQEAIDLLEVSRPGIVFLDIMMPKKNGYEVCTHLKSDPALQDAYVIMLTAKGQASDREVGLGVGADEYMTKPFSPRQIVTRVNEIAAQ